MKIKRDIFNNRGNRMQHRFGRLTDDDPLSGDTFDPQFPVFPEQNSKGLMAKRHGLYRESPRPLSPVVKPDGSGRASFNGPKPDVADAVAMPLPANTKKRTPFKPT
jgi:hypothetical protein